MRKKLIANITLIAVFSAFTQARAQKSTLDSLFVGRDSTVVMDSLMRDLDFFLDSLSAPKTFINLNISAANGIYNFKTNNSVFLQSTSRLVLTPSVAFYHKSGFGISATGLGIDDQHSLNFYQFLVSPSFDYLRNRNFAAGVVYEHYFTKDSLSFYTTPLNNEIYTYFTLKKYWIQPTIAFGYGWGSKTEYQQKDLFILAERARRRGWVIEQNTESVKDYALSVSVKHSFSFFHLFTGKDYLRVTPLLMLTSGSQNFGFNTSYSSGIKVISNNFLPSNTDITDNHGIGLQSASFILQADYVFGKFYIQPQLLLDYYIPDTDEKRFNSVAAIAIGYSF